jgi:nucleotide-binding universal stress UspA family protein
MFKRIAVATDGSETADKAVEMALDIAARYQATLLVLSVYEPVSPARLALEKQDAPEEIQWSINRTEYVDRTLADVSKRAGAHGVEAIAVAREGDPASVICELAAAHDADLLVIGNKGMQRRVFGSVPKWVCQHAPCSVVLAKTT